MINLHNQGAGLPDGGLFTADQFQKGIDLEPLPGQLPGRGAIEVKSVAADLDQFAASEQVAKYLAKYGQVLVTNYREFLLVTQGPGGKPIPGERYRLAESETAFWAAAAHPHKTAAERGERLIEYLKRAMLHSAPLTAPADLAWFLASYARDAHARVDAQADLPALASLRTAMENALGMTFQGPEGEHFFRSTLVQTLFYGVFAAWVLWHKENPARAGRFDWRLASYYLNVPVIQALFEQVSAHSKLKALGLIEPLDWAGATLNRVDRAAFFAKFEEEHAVQYFYEPFLQAYDPELRKQLGVWYTPPEIIRYMVARVDAVLRGELGVADGLADPDVYILDPCCGTGGFLVATLAHIAETLVANGEEGLLAAKLKQAATQRVFGFEILPAPLVIAHMQIGLALSRRGAPLAEDERAGVYLTNALIGWEPPDAQKEKALQQLLKAYLDASKSDEEIQAVEPRFMKSSGEFNAVKARKLLRGRVQYDPAKIVRYPFKPFDTRLAYLDSAIHPLFSRPSPELLDQRFPGNKFLVVRENSVVEPTSPPMFFSSLICDYHALAVEAKHIPFRLRSASASQFTN